jgi:hypothetical protein
MSDNLPKNQNTQDENELYYEDSRSMMLSHYIMAERCLQVEYARIIQDHNYEGTSQTLLYILEGGFRGFHKLTRQELEDAYKDIETTFYRYYEEGSLYMELVDEDPLLTLEEDENGEVEAYGSYDEDSNDHGC